MIKAPASQVYCFGFKNPGLFYMFSNTRNVFQKNVLFVKTSQKTLEKIELLIIFFILTAVYFSGIHRVQLEKDESQWIAYSDRFEFFIHGDFNNKKWFTEWNKYVNPVMSYYVIGLGRNIGGFNANELNTPYDYTITMKDNIALNAIPSPGLLWWSRAGVTIWSVIGVFIVFFLLLKSYGRIGAYSWLVIASVNKYFLTSLSQAMNEGALIGFLMISTLAVYFFLKTCSEGDIQKQWKKMILWLIVAGIAVGFAAQTKTNGAAAFIGIILAIVFGLIRMRDYWRVKLFYAAILIALVSSVTFLAFILPNPTAWNNPTQYMTRVIDARMTIIQNQSDDSSDVITSWSQRLQVVPERIFGNYMAFPPIIPTFLFFMIGAIIVSANAYQWILGQNNNHAIVALIFIGLIVSIPSLFTPLDWGRYFFLPVFFFTPPVLIGMQFFIIFFARQAKTIH